MRTEEGVELHKCCEEIASLGMKTAELRFFAASGEKFGEKRS